MTQARWWTALIVAGWAAAASGEARGAGAGWTGGQPPATKSAGPEAERAASAQQQPPRFERGLGMLGAAGAAPDRRGELRLGGFGRLRAPSAAASYGEAASAGGGASYQAWKSGDQVRSTSAADVRSARVQQAPELEWAGGQAGASRANLPYGLKVQQEQGRPRP
ncbi:hypothetical protein [Anaeromyxobacter diazotrophicus]|uniref:Uncharacterized protein n=1 Tax=Anaeromyxobacter diazotrophicus TaxID=2590199 RepID=A0A7I9VG71_9BACT|nr:hypothetical protein [Anaeromyxobacter diazotrophicus]GEJ55391.1 hypothetical protein AMYX_01320 [Anaeromyxobacter diazotrophicus]